MKPTDSVAVPDPNAASLTIDAPPPQQEYRPTGTSGMDYRPPGASGRDVAIAYYLLLGQTPDFRKWAMQSDEYIKASDFDKEAVLDKKIKELRDIVRLFTMSDPIIIDTPVMLSEYQSGRQGFIVESFRDDTFFTFSYAGEDFAVVLPHLTDFQWIDVAGPAAQEISKARGTDKNASNMSMLIYVDPKAADHTPMTLDGKNYFLISADIRNMALYAPGSPRALWEKNSKIRDEKALQELMNLYR